jgi:regulator of cell morphogenesis and NO signaling
MLDPQTPVATLVLDHSECAAVFARHQIDYCCKGERALADACSDRGLDPTEVIAELERAIASRRSTPECDPRQLSTREVIATLIAPHHQYLHRTMPFLQRLAAKVARVHGARAPSLHELERVLDTLVTTLHAHLIEEEVTLFPALVEGRLAEAGPALRDMRRDHEEVGYLLGELRRAAADYVPPDWACNSYRTLLAELANLEANTLAHVHLENHVLLPRYTR